VAGGSAAPRVVDRSREPCIGQMWKRRGKLWSVGQQEKWNKMEGAGVWGGVTRQSWVGIGTVVGAVDWDWWKTNFESGQACGARARGCCPWDAGYRLVHCEGCVVVDQLPDWQTGGRKAKQVEPRGRKVS